MQSLIEILIRWAFLWIFVGTLVEGEFTMLVAGYGAYKGALAMPVVVAAAWAGSFLGDWVFFEWGKRRGIAWFQRMPRLHQRIHKLTAYVEKHPVPALFILRFQIAMRMIGCFTVGASALDRETFLKVNALACLCWAVVIGALCFGCGLFWDLMIDIWAQILRPR